MQYSIITKLVKEKGVDNVQIPESISKEAWTEAGVALFKDNIYEESGKAFAKAGNEKELLAAGQWLTQQGRFGAASYFYKFVNDKRIIETCAHACMSNGSIKEAKMLFEILGNENMLTFLRENFGT